MAQGGLDYRDISCVAVASASALQYKIMIASGATADGDLFVGQAVSSDTETMFGVLQNKPNNNEMAAVRVDGISKVWAGDTVSISALITSDASGNAVVADSGSVVLGRAITSAVSGQLFTALLNHPRKIGPV